MNILCCDIFLVFIKTVVSTFEEGLYDSNYHKQLYMYIKEK